MSDNDRTAFGLVYRFYEKWRETTIQSQEQWDAFAKDVGKLGTELDGNLLGWRLLNAVLDHFNDLYMGGMVPVPLNYFGRDDM